MEPKKVKKLVLKKEDISYLNESSQSQVKGGWGVTTIGDCNSNWTCCSGDWNCHSQGTRCPNTTCDSVEYTTCQAGICY